MSASSLLEGNFVNFVSKSWDSFTPQDGRPVAAGRSLRLSVYTPHDKDLCEVRIDAACIDQVLPIVSALDFGVVVAVHCGDKYSPRQGGGSGYYKGFSVERASASAKS